MNKAMGDTATAHQTGSRRRLTTNAFTNSMIRPAGPEVSSKAPPSLALTAPEELTLVRLQYAAGGSGNCATAFCCIMAIAISKFFFLFTYDLETKMDRNHKIENSVDRKLVQ